MKPSLALLIFLSAAAPLRAQTRLSVASSDVPAISLRPLFLASGEELTARETFKGVFGGAFQPFWGGGLQVAFRNGLYIEVDASRFKKTGQRVSRSTTGDVFSLGNSLTTTLTPLEITGGYRIHADRDARVVPYVGGGVGYYMYKETCVADASRPGLCQAIDSDVDTQHVGLVLTGGAEIRVHRWIGIGLDAYYTHVSGILGAGGVSGLAEVNEKDLGGLGARIKVIVGR